MKILILIFAGLFASAAQATDCSSGLKDVLLDEARALNSRASLHSALYFNTDNGVNRSRRLILPLGDATNSFSEFFSRDGVGLRVFFIEKANGRFRNFLTNLDVTEVTFCSNDSQNVDVDWIEGFPKIGIQITCSADPEIQADGHIQYFDEKVEIVGGVWQKSGVPTLCDGQSSIGTATYL